jgi:hypothetical protein
LRHKKLTYLNTPIYMRSLKYNVLHECVHATRQNLKLQVKNDRSESFNLFFISKSYRNLNFIFLKLICYIFGGKKIILDDSKSLNQITFYKSSIWRINWAAQIDYFYLKIWDFDFVYGHIRTTRCILDFLPLSLSLYIYIYKLSGSDRLFKILMWCMDTFVQCVIF